LELGEVTAEGIELRGQLLRRGVELAHFDVASLELEEGQQLFAHVVTFPFAG
jgi:hypothetical protein